MTDDPTLARSSLLEDYREFSLGDDDCLLLEHPSSSASLKAAWGGEGEPGQDRTPPASQRIGSLSAHWQGSQREATQTVDAWCSTLPAPQQHDANAWLEAMRPNPSRGWTCHAHEMVLALVTGGMLAGLDTVEAALCALRTDSGRHEPEITQGVVDTIGQKLGIIARTLVAHNTQVVHIIYPKIVEAGGSVPFGLPRLVCEAQRRGKKMTSALQDLLRHTSSGSPACHTQQAVRVAARAAQNWRHILHVYSKELVQDCLFQMRTLFAQGSCPGGDTATAAQLCSGVRRNRSSILGIMLQGRDSAERSRLLKINHFSLCQRMLTAPLAVSGHHKSFLQPLLEIVAQCE